MSFYYFLLFSPFFSLFFFLTWYDGLVTQVVLSAHSLTCDAFVNPICSWVPLTTGAVWVKAAAGGGFTLLLSEGRAGRGLISQTSHLKGQMGVTG